MKPKLACLILSAVLLPSSQVSVAAKSPQFLKNLPPWENSEAPPAPVSKNPPVYLDVDSKGNVYTMYLIRDKNGTYKSKFELVSKKTVDKLSSLRVIILQNMENISLPSKLNSQKSSSATSSSSNCPLPNTFSIWGDSNGTALGFQKLLNTNRPSETNTQWVTFDFWTDNYRLAGGHMPTALFFKDGLLMDGIHGWGTFIGDNHLGNGCGSSSRFNSQIEAWNQVSGDLDVDGNHIPGIDWQSLTFNGPNSCGNEMYDGKVLAFIVPFVPVFVPKYRMEIQANTAHLVAYRILRFYQGDYNLFTDWRSLDVGTGNWPHGTPDLDENAQGILFEATNTLNGGWSINMSNVQCGWF